MQSCTDMAFELRQQINFYIAMHQPEALSL